MQKLLSDKMIKKKIYEAEKRDEIVKLVKSIIVEKIGESIDIDVIEEATTDIFKRIRIQTAREIISEKDVTEWYCPHCNNKMENKEKVQHKVQGLVSYDFRIRYFHCDNCGANEKPAKKLMGCLGGFSYSAKKAMVLLGQRIPFEEAEGYLKELLGIEISSESIRKLTENVGQELHNQEDNRVNELINKETGNVQTSTKQEAVIEDTAYMELDGCMVQTREDGWKEVKNGILFSESKNIKMDKNHNQLWEKQYFSEFSDLETFKNRATQEAYDFKFHQYRKQVVLGDGALWIWDYFTEHHPNAIQILDYFHASEYLGKAIQSLSLENESIRKSINRQLYRKLKAGNIERIVNFLDTKLEQTKDVITCSRYFWKNKDRMRYWAYRKQGLSIGSGAIESAHRIIVQTRMKQSGMHWGKSNVQSIISLRAVFLSGQWNPEIMPIIKAAA